MKIIVTNDYKELSEQAAKIIQKAIESNPNLVLGLATGSTPLGLYKELIKLQLDFSNVKVFNLDEYLGLSPEHIQSYNYYLKNNLLDHINIKKENIFIHKGNFDNPEQYCKEYERNIEQYPIDMQILGIGRNGHIGFNEPGSSIDSITRIINLDPITIKDNARFFNNHSEVPVKAITMGISTILKAKQCILLANGENKQEIVKKALKGPITPDIPASFLQNHPNLTVIIDKEAAGIDFS